MRTFTRVPQGPFWRSNAWNVQPHHGVRSAEGPIHTDPADRVSAGPVQGPWPHPAPVSRIAQAPSDSGPIGRTGDRCPTGRGEERGQPGCSAGPRVAPPPTAAPGHVRASGRRCQLDARRPSPCPSRDHALHCGGHRDGARSRPWDPGHVGAGGRLCDGDAVRPAGRVSCRPRRSPEKWHPGLSPLLWHRALVDGDGVGAGTGASPRGQAVPRSRGLQPDCLRERAPEEAAPAAVSLGAGWAGAGAVSPRTPRKVAPRPSLGWPREGWHIHTVPCRLSGESQPLPGPAATPPRLSRELAEGCRVMLDGVPCGQTQTLRPLAPLCSGPWSEAHGWGDEPPPRRAGD